MTHFPLVVKCLTNDCNGKAAADACLEITARAKLVGVFFYVHELTCVCVYASSQEQEILTDSCEKPAIRNITWQNVS